MKVKKVIVILLIFIIIAVGIIGVFINSKKLLVEYDKNIEVSLNQEIYNIDNIHKVSNGKIISDKELIDTSK